MTISNMNDPDMRSQEVLLRAEQLPHALYLTIALTWGVVMRFLQWPLIPETLSTWPLVIVLVITIVSVQRSKSRYPAAASYLLIGGLGLANTLEIVLFSTTLAPFLFPVILIIAAQLTSERGTVAVTVSFVTIMSILPHVLHPALARQDFLQPIILIILTGVISWSGMHHFHLILDWALSSSKHAILAADQAQTHRAELIKQSKQLDIAHHQLERMNWMLVLARQEAEEARMLKVQFANAVTHELRSPLNIIIGFSDMIVNCPEAYGPQPWPPRLAGHIRQIYQNSQHLSQLIDDVLDIARIDAYRLNLNRETCSPIEIIEEAIAMARSLYEARGLYLRMDNPGQIPQVSVDRLRIRQVLLNLLTNAVRFMAHGGVSIQITHNGREVQIGVSDTGIGITPEDMSGLFQEFRQAGNSLYHWHQGSGLGLVISKQLIELHSGRIWAESTPGKGSTFCFTLLIEPQPTETRLRNPAVEKQFWDYLNREAREHKPVICLSSEPELRRIIDTNLSSCDIQWATDWLDVLRLAKQVQPLAIIRVSQASLNDSLPPGEVLEHLPGTPFVTWSFSKTASQFTIEGIDEYLVKPISRQKLSDVLKHLVIEPNRILIVDDDGPIREYLTSVLEIISPQYQILQVDNGKKALEVLRVFRPDVVLLDLTLPDMDGLDLAVQLRSYAEPPVVIAVTARDNPAEILPEQPSSICYSRLGRFNKRELERVLNAILDSLAPAGEALHAESSPVVDGELVSVESGLRLTHKPNQHHL
jgi:signal transduction histidine kinase/CheY-like chemotaxis protein